MKDLLQILFLSIIGAIIGWITNYIAIKMLFRPLKPVKIPIINYQFQGLIPKRKEEIARAIGEVVEKELISFETIIDELFSEGNKKLLLGIIKRNLIKEIYKKIPNVVFPALRNWILSQIENYMDRELDNFVERYIHDIVREGINRISIAKMVEEKISGFELEKLEDVIIGLSKRELKHIEILGGVLGFIIGFLQAIVLRFVNGN